MDNLSFNCLSYKELEMLFDFGFPPKLIKKRSQPKKALLYATQQSALLGYSTDPGHVGIAPAPDFND